jgi:Family of unknown function (DUF5678)
MILEEETNKRRLRKQWLKEHRAEYAGLYVALDGAKLISAGENRTDVFEQAKAMGCSEAFIFYVYPPDYVGEITDELIAVDLETARSIRNSLLNQCQSDSAVLLREDRRRNH